MPKLWGKGYVSSGKKKLNLFPRFIEYDSSQVAIENGAKVFLNFFCGSHEYVF